MYIRCLRPSPSGSAQLDVEYVTRQLRCTGIVDAAAFRQMAYHEQMTKDRFVKRFRYAQPCLSRSVVSSHSGKRADRCLAPLSATNGRLRVPRRRWRAYKRCTRM
jgi:myosin heavy subunit